MARRKKKTTEPTINYNRVLKHADYETLGISNRKEWEIEMALRSLRDNGAVHEDAQILGVGAAKEATIFHLSNEVKWVFASDMYLNPGMWAEWLPQKFMVRPGDYCPDDLDCRAGRIIVQHADMRKLPYEDNTFDGVFSSSSIEHVGSMGDIAKAASEIGRVVKPGGIISLSTEWKLSGEGEGVGHVKMMDEGTLKRYIIDATGCELIDDLDMTFDRPLQEAHSQELWVKTRQRPEIDTHLYLKQYIFTSVHIALRKPA